MQREEVQNIIAGLLCPDPYIAPKYFYDAEGCILFETITDLPEYYLTRTERAIMVESGTDIAAQIGACKTVIEPGAGSCEKAKMLCALVQPERFVAIDIAAQFLAKGAAKLRAAMPQLVVQTAASDLSKELLLPDDIPRSKRLLYYPGSSIGNFDEHDAQALLTRMRNLLDADGALLIGFDVAKEQSILEAAYNDARGVTAAFNVNILRHVNLLIGSDFVPHAWRHVAFFNAQFSRIEMHLEANKDNCVRWRQGGMRDFKKGVRIHTENSYKYRVEDFQELLLHSGFTRSQTWSDARGWFSIMLARP